MKHGNSSGVILDQPVLKQVGWENGTEVEVRVEGASIVLTQDFAHFLGSGQVVRIEKIASSLAGCANADASAGRPHAREPSEV